MRSDVVSRHADEEKAVNRFRSPAEIRKHPLHRRNRKVAGRDAFLANALSRDACGCNYLLRLRHVGEALARDRVLLHHIDEVAALDLQGLDVGQQGLQRVLVRKADKKFRYLLPNRVRYYRFVRETVSQYLPQVPIFMCMESGEAWQRALGGMPKSDGELSVIFKR